ncbi:SPJ_0845 family protein [Streptococcus rifensis]
MPVTFKKQDDWDKLLEQFASFDDLEKVEFPDPNAKESSENTEDA